MAGSIFENWVVSELVKSFWFKGKEANLYFWRTKDGMEIDLLYESGGLIYPAEIKLASSPDSRSISAFKKLEDTGDVKVASARKIICTAKENISIGKGVELVSALSIK